MVALHTRLDSGVDRIPRMARYRVLKRVAHDLGHSYLSLMNYRAEDYVVENLHRAARAAHERRVVIDVLRGTMEPAAVRTPVFLESVADQQRWLGRRVQTQGAALDMASAATITVDFDFEGSRSSPNVPGLELPAYTCTVEMVDDRGRTHTATVPEWCRY